MATRSPFQPCLDGWPDPETGGVPVDDAQGPLTNCESDVAIREEVEAGAPDPWFW